MTARLRTVHLLLILLIMPVLWAEQPVPVPPAAVPAPPPQPLQIGINSHLATRYPDAARLDEAAALVAELGVSWVREDLHWHRIEPAPGQWDWVFSDRALTALDQRGLQILAVLGPSVGWGTAEALDGTHEVSYYPPRREAFLRYTAATVERYAPLVDAWELWNEPDLGVFWRPSPDARAYADLLIAVARIIRRADPQAPILLGGINPFHRDFLADIAAAGAWSSFDVLAVHPYVDPNTPEQGALQASTDQLRGLFARFGSKPIWATEVGVASGPGDRDAQGVFDAEQQADLIARTYLALWQAGVSHIFWYTLKDDPHNPYGLYAYGTGRDDFSRPKPAAAEFVRFAHSADQAAWLGSTALSADDLLDPLSTTTWLRPSQPNGRVRNDSGGSQIDLLFTTATNDYLVFAFAEPLLLPADTHHLQINVDGNAAGHALNVWLRDSDGDILQYRLGLLDGSRTQLIAPIGGRVGNADRIAVAGNGRADALREVVAIVIDDLPDSWSGTASFTVRDLRAAAGSDARQLQLRNAAGHLLLLSWADQQPADIPPPDDRRWYRYDAAAGCRDSTPAARLSAASRVTIYSDDATPRCRSSTSAATPPRR